MSNVNPDRTEWRMMPRGADGTMAFCTYECLHLTLRVLGLNEVQSRHCSGMLFEWNLLHMIEDDLNQTVSISSSDATLIDLTCDRFSKTVAKHASFADTTMTSDQLQVTMNYINQLQARVHKMRAAAEAAVPPPIEMMPHETIPMGASVPMFGRLRASDMGVEHLAGVKKVDPILLPVELTNVGDSCKTFNEVGAAMRNCINQCLLLANQSHLIANSYCLRVALIQHLFINIIPLPLPHNHPRRSKQCFWASSPMRYETQADILRLLDLLSRHYIACALSLKVTRSFDACRILTMSVMVTIGDVVLRVKANDVPSQFAMHYSGLAEGPVHPYAMDMGMFAAEGEYLRFTNPDMQCALTSVLDYHTQLMRAIRPDHIVFKFEESAGFGYGEQLLLDQLALQVAFPRDDLAMCLSGENPVLIDHFPEIQFFRDMCFLFKCTMAPTSDSLPDLRRWSYTDARLEWKWQKRKPLTEEQKLKAKEKADKDAAKAAKAAAKGEKPKAAGEPDSDDDALSPDQTEAEKAAAAASMGVSASGMVDDDEFDIPEGETGAFVVRGFGGKRLKAIYWNDTVEKKVGANIAKKRGLFGKLKDVLGMAGGAPRVPPSAANPTNLAGKKVEVEDDVLHIRQLPDFNGRMNARDCELLLQYLTVPYLRIPLMLEFFADPLRIVGLGHESLQEVLDACLFEPSTWQPTLSKPRPEVIPALTREHMQTPAGLLFNELICSPGTITRSVNSMLDHVLEMDTGRYAPTSSPLIMYVLRLVVRVEEYMIYVMQHWNWMQQANKQAADEAIAPGEWTALSTYKTYVRGLYCQGGTAAMLASQQAELRSKLDERVFPMLERWVAVCTRQNEIGHCCIVYAHLAYLHKNMLYEHLNRRVVSIMLIAQNFLTINYRYDIEIHMGDTNRKRTTGQAAADPNGPQVVDDDGPMKVNQALGIPQMEVFDLFTRHRRKCMLWLLANKEECNQVMESIVRVVTFTGKRTTSKSDMTARTWNSMKGHGCLGRFVPDTDNMDADRVVGADGGTHDTEIFVPGADVEELERKRQLDSGQITFERWLWLTTTQSVDVEINIQLGEFSLKKHQMKQLHQMPLMDERVYQNQDLSTSSARWTSTTACSAPR